MYKELYSTLLSGLEMINAKKAELSEIQEKIGSGLYHVDLQRKFIAARDRLKAEIENVTAETISAADKLFDDEISRLEQADAVKGTDLSEDAALLNSGLKLNRRDIASMLAKESNQNATMQRMIREYAAERKIPLPEGVSAHYIGNNAEVQRLTAERASLRYAEKWVHSDRAAELIDRTFGAAAAAESEGE